MRNRHVESYFKIDGRLSTTIIYVPLVVRFTSLLVHLLVKRLRAEGTVCFFTKYLWLFSFNS